MSVRRLAIAALLALSACGAGTRATTGAPSAAVDDRPAGAATSSPTPTATAKPVTAPPANAQVDYQLGGGYSPPKGTTVVTRDVTDTPAKGLYNICYVNAFQTQPGQNHISSLVLRNAKGTAVSDPDWPGEYLYDISTASKRAAVLAVIGPQIDTCAQKGFKALEPDNLDSWTRSGGLLTKAEAAAFATILVARAHADGLAIAQKNTTDLLGARLGFDFAVVEECQTYDECGEFKAAYGQHVIEIEYVKKEFTKACAAQGSIWSIVLRDRNVSPIGTKGYVYAAC